MLILFLMVGIVFGSAAGGFVLWSGGSILFALLCYSLFGTLGAVGVVLFLYYLGEMGASDADWQDGKDTHEPISA